MKSKDSYEINISDLFGICLLHWKKITAFVIIAALLASAVSVLTFKEPQSSVKYRQIEEALTRREIYEEKLLLANKSFEENLFYSMDPEKIIKKELAVAFELANQDLITEQTDPTDSVVYAYYNLAQSELIEGILSDSVLTRLQKEQFLEINQSNSSNTVFLSVTCDNEELIDEVLAICAKWFSEKTNEISEKTFEHSLNILPISADLYSRAEAAELTGTAAAEENIVKLEAKIEEYNTFLSSAFNKADSWALNRSTAEIEEYFSEIKERESSPKILTAALIGVILGGISTVLWYCTPTVIKGVLPGYDSVFEGTGWKKIGRINTLPEYKDKISQYGCKMLYGDFEKSREDLKKETCEMAKMLLKDACVPSEGILGIIGKVPTESFGELTALLEGAGVDIKTADLSDRVCCNKLCREANAIIFVGTADKVCFSEAEALDEIIRTLDKKVLGYILV